MGTTGIVEPMSEQALVDTIRVELQQRRAGGAEYVLLTPGNYGTEFIRMDLQLQAETAVQVSNFIGDALDLCHGLGFRGALLVGHIGKLVKLCGGMMNTHSKYGDCRMEILTAHASAVGLRAPQAKEMLQCATCDDALRILQEEGLYEATLERLTEKMAEHLQRRATQDLEMGVLSFSRVYGLLGKTGNAERLMKYVMEGK